MSENKIDEPMQEAAEPMQEVLESMQEVIKEPEKIEYNWGTWGPCEYCKMQPCGCP